MLEWMQPAPAVKTEAKVEAKAEPKLEPKAEPKPEPKAEPTSVPPAPVAAVATAPGGASAPVAPWVLVGAGGLLAVAGGITFGVALGWHDDYVKRLHVDPLPAANFQDLPTYAQAQTTLSMVNTLMLIGGLGAGVGLAGVAGGLTWRFKQPGAPPTTVSIAPGPGSFIVRGEF